MSNAHFARAIMTSPHIDENMERWVSEEGQTDATLVWTAIERQTEATLALAHEQRTANLIAYLNTSALHQWSHSAEAVRLRGLIAVELDLMTREEVNRMIDKHDA